MVLTKGRVGDIINKLTAREARITEVDDKVKEILKKELFKENEKS